MHLLRCCSERKHAAGIKFVTTLQIKFDAFTLALKGLCFPLHILLQPIEPVLGHTANLACWMLVDFPCDITARCLQRHLQLCCLVSLPAGLSRAGMALAARLMSRLIWSRSIFAAHTHPLCYHHVDAHDGRQLCGEVLRCAGPDHLDVPGSSERPCRVTLLALAEGAAAATITLRNQATGEHMFWTLAYSAAPAPVRHEKNKLYNNENLMSWAATLALQYSSHPCPAISRTR